MDRGTSRPPPEELLKHAGFLRALAYRLVGDDARADDLVQEAYVAALEKPPRGSPRAWLGAVVRNLAGKVRRSEGRRRAREHRAAARREPLPGPDDVAARIELHRDLVQAVDALDEPYRSTIVLRFLYDLKPREVAARQKIPVETVRTRTQRALETLRGRIDRKKLALALLPLPALKSAAGAALTWGIVMGTKRRVVFALLLLVLATGGTFALLGRDGADAPRSADVRASDVAAPVAAVEPDVPTSADSDDDPNRTPGPDIVVRGLVLLDGAPVEGAHVALRRADPPVRMFDIWTQGYRRITAASPRPIGETRTDVDGRFALQCAHRTAFTVEAREAGATPACVLVNAPATEDLTIRLGRGREIEGRVVDETGAPVPGATVRWRRSLGRTLRVRGETVTGEDGRFRLPAGERTGVLVTAAGYAPATADEQDVSPIVLTRGGRVTGAVSSADGSPVANAVILLATSVPAETRTDAQGRYALRLPAGHLVHAMVHAGGRPALSSWTDELALPPRPVRRDRDVAFDITLPPGMRLRGTVTHGDLPVADARVTLYRTNARVPAAVAVNASGADGAVSFGLVPDGTYELRARAGVLCGSGTVHVVDAAAPDPVAIAVAGTGRIEGAVTGDLPVAFVHLQSGDQADVDALGRFVFEDVAPTDATHVYVMGTTARTETFAVDPGETVRVTLDSGTARLVRGRVAYAGGAPVAGALVALFDKSHYAYRHVEVPTLRARGVRTDGDGRFVAPLPDAPPLLVAYHPDAAPVRTESVDLDGSELVVTLEPGRVVSGRVVWPDGTLVRDMQVRTRAAQPSAFGVVENALWRRFRTGEFELRDLGTGQIRIEVRHADGAAAPRVVETGTRDLVITLQQTKSIRGAVVDAAGRPVSAAKITAGKDGTQVYSVHSTHQGRFEIPRLDRDGIYDLHLEPGTQSDWHPPKLSPFEPTVVTGVAAGTHDIIVRVETGDVLSGVVLDPDGQPVLKAFVAALGKPGRLAPGTHTGAGGRFTLAGLTAEHTELLVKARGMPARAVPLGRNLEIRLERGESLRLRFHDPDGAPVANRWISAGVAAPALSAQTKDWLARLGRAPRGVGWIGGAGAQTDRDGRVEIGGLMPGEYRVSMFRTQDAIAPETVARTGEAERAVRLQRTYSIIGTVVDPENRPVGSQRLRLWINVAAYRGEARLGGTVVAEDGTFEIDGVTAGPVRLKVDYSGVPPGYRGEATVQAGARDLRVVVTRQK